MVLCRQANSSLLIMLTEQLPLTKQTYASQYRTVRDHSENICRYLQTEDYVVQPIVDVSPPKWHLGHTTWFWETFVLVPNLPGYQIFHEDFSFVFNSYYETVGRRVLRTDRGNLSRPTVADVYRYRAYVDVHMERFLTETEGSPELGSIIDLGLNHEQQHQELLITDIKYILGHNPLFPSLDLSAAGINGDNTPVRIGQDIRLSEGVYTIGYTGDDFCFDNELGIHKVYLNETIISTDLVTNAEFIEFIEAGGYQNFRFWLSDGWAWVKANAIQAPLYWYKIDGQWHSYTFDGLQPVSPNEPVCHVSHYEADAYARWCGQRLPTEFEWEAANERFEWGLRWEWTGSAYLPYPGFKTAEGAVGEYNGKFMSSQMVLRGASVATPDGHARPTYRNFFQPDKRWQYTGIRLAK